MPIHYGIQKHFIIEQSRNEKSILANVLSGTEKFKESSSGNKFRVIDTIGFSDTSLNHKEVLTEIAKGCTILKDGLYQIFFIIGSKFDKEEIESYNLLKEVIFGSEIVKYITIVCTKFPKFKEEACIEEKNKLCSENKELAELVCLSVRFGLKNVGRNNENEIFEALLEEDNFDQLYFRFNNVLTDMLAHENDEDSEIESQYAGEYDSNIEKELEQNNNSNNEQDFNNKYEEERNEIIPIDTNEGPTCKYSVLPLTPCVIINNIQAEEKDAVTISG
ncbi:hypothetical protein C1645_832733 [Glomus cerebriforme]|uniref:AIG1-type G domain-containing protein n=1 Tax=Glomus cerebriforme TaxID=658196 RepID=A0A397SJI4_9GLOM|nr:hypothetical protein C1645_832733 [Glomus cerebriforme]